MYPITRGYSFDKFIIKSKFLPWGVQPHLVAEFNHGIFGAGIDKYVSDAHSLSKIKRMNWTTYNANKF